MSGKAPRKSDAIKVRRKALGVVNSNAPYPSMDKYASKKELGDFQEQLDAMLANLKQQVEDEQDKRKKSNSDC